MRTKVRNQANQAKGSAIYAWVVFNILLAIALVTIGGMRP